MKNKKGFLDFVGGEAGEIVIAIACLLVLALLVAKLFALNTIAQDRKKAEGIAQGIISIASSLKEGEEKNYSIPALTEWVVYSTYGWLKPLSCNGQKECLCVCPKVEESEIALSCYNKGFCKQTFNFQTKNDEGKNVQNLEISAPIEGINKKYSQITIKNNGENNYEISYTKGEVTA